MIKTISSFLVGVILASAIGLHAQVSSGPISSRTASFAALIDGSASAPSLTFASQPGLGIYKNATDIMGWMVPGYSSTVPVAVIRASGFVVGSAATWSFSSTSDASASADVTLARDAANTLAQRNGTNAQTFRLYNTFTDASNYERAFFAFSAGTLQIGQQGAGTGSSRAIQFVQAGTVPLELNGTNVLVNQRNLLLNSATNGVGYGTGAGGAVTQITSRTTGVTLNTVTGDITLFSAAGSATAASFTVTNSAVAITDNIIINQKSGTNLYNTIVTTVGAGSFVVTFYTTGGVATDSPVFHFSVIKGVNS